MRGAWAETPEDRCDFIISTKPTGSDEGTVGRASGRLTVSIGAAVAAAYYGPFGTAPDGRLGQGRDA